MGIDAFMLWITVALLGSTLSGVSGQELDRAEALREAARRGDVSMARSLLEEGVDVNSGNRYGATALFFAADKGNLAMVRLLVGKGADLDVLDSFYQMSALMRALSNDHHEVALLLLERGAPGADATLLEGVRANNPALVRAALQSGRVERDGYDRAAALAVEAGEIDLVELIVATERPAPERPDRTLQTTELAPFAGRYQNDALQQIVTVTLEGDSLVARGERFETATPLLARGERTFVAAGSDTEAIETRVRFAGRGGMIERMLVQRGEETTSFRPIDESESREAAPALDVAAANALSSTADVEDLSSSRKGPARPWPSFRGPNGSGVADGQAIPTVWDGPSGKNILWKQAVPGLSVSSPIIWGDRVYIVTAVSAAGDSSIRTGLYGDVAPVDDLSEHRWLLLALDKASGKIVWEREMVRAAPETKRHPKSSQANATPVTDGNRIVVSLGAVGLLLAYDLDGELAWKNEIGVLNSGWFYDPDYQWGHSSSPIIYDDTVILQADVHQGSFIAAFELESGAERWRTVREDEIPTFSTPSLYRGTSGDELVTNGTQIRGYDPSTGKPLWSLGPNSEIPIGLPVVTRELIYVTAGYPPIRPIYAIRPGSRGDLTSQPDEALAWSKTRGGTYIPSPLVYRSLFYTNANNGRLTCYDAATGERVYRARIGGVGGSYSASPIAADGRLFFFGEEGDTYVVRAGKKYQLLSKNSLDDVIMSTPAASDGVLVIRTRGHVYGIGE